MQQQLLNTELTLETLPLIAIELLQLNQKIMLFNGPMGAGKTTLIKQICMQLGSNDSFSSPTYQLVNEYKFLNGKIYHFDLYRLKSLEELLDIGFEDYLQPNNFCFIEWPEFAQQFLQSNFLKVDITVQKNIRYLSASKY